MEAVPRASNPLHRGHGHSMQRAQQRQAGVTGIMTSTESRSKLTEKCFKNVILVHTINVIVLL